MQDGRFKHISNRLRDVSRQLDYAEILPDFLAFVPGDLSLEAVAATLTLLACATDVAGCVFDGDKHGAGQELHEGVAESLAVLVPIAQYAKLLERVPGLRRFSFDIRGWARAKAGEYYIRKYNPPRAMAAERGLWTKR